jgi:ParB family chromosome partitioning protein
VVWRGIEALIPYARNARTDSDAQIAQIAGSIREFGFTNPVLIDAAGPDGRPDRGSRARRNELPR